VLGFFSSRPNWNSLTPSPAGEFAPPPPAGYLGGGGGIDSLAGEGVGVPIPTMGQKLWFSRYICYWGEKYKKTRKVEYMTEDYAFLIFL
jgi:hypothetical protein